MKKTVLMLVCATLLGFGFANAQSNYKIVRKISIEGDKGWDLLFSDDEAGRLYVSHGDRVQVVDQKNDEVIGTISNLDGVHGIAIANTLNRGYISTKNDNSVTIFDTKTFKVVKQVKIPGKSPDAILFDAFSKKVFVCNAHSNSVSVMNPESGEIIATIELPGNPELSVSNGKGKIYINLESSAKIAVIDATANRLEHSWSIAPGEGPTGLALDNETHRLFSVCSNKLLVVTDAENGHVIETLPIGDHPDGASFDPELKRVYSSNKDGTLTILQEDANGKLVVLENFPTQKGAKNMALNQITHHIYLSIADFETPKDGKPQIVPNSFGELDIVPNKTNDK